QHGGEPPVRRVCCPPVGVEALRVDKTCQPRHIATRVDAQLPELHFPALSARPRPVDCAAPLIATLPALKDPCLARKRIFISIVESGKTWVLARAQLDHGFDHLLDIALRFVHEACLSRANHHHDKKYSERFHNVSFCTPIPRRLKSATARAS